MTVPTGNGKGHIMKLHIRILSLALSAAMLLGTVGCLVKKDVDVERSAPETQTQTTDPAATAEVAGSPVNADRDAIAVTLGDITVTAGEIENMYNAYIQMMQMYGMTAPTDEESINSYVQTSIEALISDSVYEWKAKQLGITLTEDELAEIDAKAHIDAAAEYSDLVLSYAQHYTDAGEAESVAALTAEQLEDALYYLNLDVQSYYGDTTSDIDVYVSDAFNNYKKMYTSEAYMNKLQDETSKDVTVDEEAIEAWYADQLDKQKSAMNGDPSMYRTYRQDLESGFSETPILYVPEGIALVKVIELEPEEEEPAEMADIENQMASLEAEFGKLALNNASAAELQSVRDRYAAQQAALLTLQDQYTGATKSQAEALYDRLVSGEAFDDVAVSVSEDAAKEQVISLNESDPNFPDDVRFAAARLKDGEFSPIVRVGNAFYIVQMVGRVAAGEVDRVTIADAIRAAAAADARDDAWSAKIDEWGQEALAAAVINHDALAYIGK